MRVIYAKWWPLNDVMEWATGLETIREGLVSATWDHYLGLSPNAQGHKDAGAIDLSIELVTVNPGFMVTLGYLGGK